VEVLSLEVCVQHSAQPSEFAIWTKKISQHLLKVSSHHQALNWHLALSSHRPIKLKKLKVAEHHCEKNE
jgi:hypothetical protein